jgi:hypothetical protein
MTQTTVTYTLEEVLKRIENKIDNQTQDIKELREDVNNLKVDIVEVKTEQKNIKENMVTKAELAKLSSEINTIKENSVTQKNQIWSLITILAVAVLGILATGAKIAFFP